MARHPAQLVTYSELSYLAPSVLLFDSTLQRIVWFCSWTPDMRYEGEHFIDRQRKTILWSFQLHVGVEPWSSAGAAKSHGLGIWAAPSLCLRVTFKSL